MADIALVTANKVEVAESFEQMTVPAAEAITAGAPVRIDTSTGKFTNANATTAAEARVYGIATKTVAAGQPVTAIRHGVLDGFAFGAGTDYDEDVWLSDTDGRVADAAGTVNASLGRCVPGTSTTLGTAFDKLFLVDCRDAEASTLDSLTVAGGLTVNGNTALGNSAAADTVTVTADTTVATGGTVAVTDADALTVGGVIVPQGLEISVECLLNADAIDRAFFIANRAYQVTAIREIHAVAGDDAGAVSLQVTKDTGTNAPGAGTNLLTNNANAGFDMKGTANTVQAGTLSATASDLQLAAGNRLSLDFAGTVTTLAGVVVTVSLKAI